MKSIISILLTALLFTCCEQSSEANFPKLYTYRGFDSTGNLIIKGTLTVSKLDSLRISGDWLFSQLAGTGYVGPQSGAGNFEGFLYYGKYRINLNPKWRDNNVYLMASFEVNSLTGTWEWDGYNGRLNYGTFHATRR